jgi:hypothetical protein
LIFSIIPRTAEIPDLAAFHRYSCGHLDASSEIKKPSSHQFEGPLLDGVGDVRAAEFHGICDQCDWFPLAVPEFQKVGYPPRGSVALVHRYHLHFAYGPIHEGPDRCPGRKHASLEPPGERLDGG